MPRQRQSPPSPISIPLPPNLTASSTAETNGIPLTSYLALPPPSSTPNFFLRLKRSASQLRSPSPSPAFSPALTPPVSPTPSALLSPTLFPLPPTRKEEEEDDRPFANLAPRSPTTGSKPWLELPTGGSPEIGMRTVTFATRSESEREESRWPLTPDSPCTPLKEPYSPERHSPSRHGKNLVFPHKPKTRITSNVFPTFPSPKQRRVVEEIDDDSDIDAPLSLAPGSPRRRSTLNLPLLPTPPRSPIRNGLLSPPELTTPATPQTPPSRPRSMIAPSPPPTSALPPIPADNSLGLAVETPATPPRSLRTTSRITPNAPARPRRIFSDYPSLSTVSPSKRIHFPNGPTSKRRPKTPFPVPSSTRPISAYSYASSSSNETDQDLEFSSSSHKDSFETSDSSFSSQSSSSRPSKARPVTVHPPTSAAPPPPRPPRSPLRPISRSVTPLPILHLEPSAFEEEEEDEEAILRPNRFLLSTDSRDTTSSSRRRSTHSLGTVNSKDYYTLMGFDQKRFGVIAGIRGVEENDKLVSGRSRRRPQENVVELGGLPEEVRENFLRMSFDEESATEEEERRVDVNERLTVKNKIIANGSQDSLDDTFVLEMTEKMLWG
ncbi:uncharacterized protein JCM6883_003309 [Sporobolomyces salmoneus]|uniref:uncharacterized protein n=1 Tax=Sporobolomyces salmoneus TaxID=183962 RepID=UPI003180B519